MKLSSVLLSAAFSGLCLAVSAVPVSAGVVWLQGKSVEQVGGSDDLKSFFDKSSLASDGKGNSFWSSLGKNTSSDDINFVTNGPVTLANGNAGIKHADHNNTWTTLTVTPGLTGFDGMIMRGQIEETATCHEKKACSDSATLDFIVTFSDGSVTRNLFTVKLTSDFGAIGFDETFGTVGKPVKQVVVTTQSGFNFVQIKEMDYSTVTSGVPELSTWAMMLAGFGGLSFVGYRRNKASPSAA